MSAQEVFLTLKGCLTMPIWFCDASCDGNLTKRYKGNFLVVSLWVLLHINNAMLAIEKIDTLHRGHRNEETRVTS